MNESRRLGGAIPFLVGLAVLCSAPGCAPASDPTAPGAKLHWRKSTPLPEPRAGHAAGLLDGKFVIAGGTWWEGEKGNWTQKIFSASTHAFDPETETWERLPDAPFPFGYSAYAVVENRLYVLGGFDGRQEIRKILRLSRQGDEYRVGGLRRAAPDSPVRMGRQFRVFPLSAGRSGALRTHRRGRHLLHLQDGHQQLERPGHGHARSRAGGSCRPIPGASGGCSRPRATGRASGCSAGSTRPKPEFRLSGSTRPCTTTSSRTSGRNSLPFPTKPWRPGRWFRFTFQGVSSS